LVEVPFDRRVAEKLLQVPRTAVPDLPDRIIAATALYQAVPIISRDHKIRASSLSTVW
jgi:PIN domain nuclease of toxin-antitoxin system